MKSKALGRGLSALIPGAEDKNSLLEIPVKSITMNPFQPRETINPQALQELADSIRENGIIQPLAVCTKEEGGYQLITGGRRLRAAQMAGLRTVPVVVIEVESDAELLELALVENLQREDLNPLELAQGYRRLIEECGLTQEEVAVKVGKSRPTVTNTLRLLKLPEAIKQGLRTGEISMGHAKALVSVEDADFARSIYLRIIREGLNVRQLERLISKGKPSISKSKSAPAKNPHYIDIENRLRSIFGTKVSLSPRRKGGIIEITFFSEEDLERLLELLEAGGDL